MLVFAMIRIESNFDRYALSEKGAKGLMQITDKTGLWGGEVLKINDFSTTYLFKPDINIRIGCWYMSNLIKEFHGDTALAIIAYNGGSGRVREWLKDRELSKTGKELEKIPYEETDKYVKKVIQEYELLRYLYQ
jgi:soluble lytic murein transglycosylase